jgi:hypothetical protein
VMLMQWCIDLREQLWWGLDLEDTSTEVNAFKRTVDEHRRRS